MMNVSKGLEALNQLKQCVTNTHFNSRDFVDIALDVGKQSETIEKELKALEIIREIGFYEIDYMLCVGYDTYCESRDKPIEKEKYDLLKEVLRKEKQNEE